MENPAYFGTSYLNILYQQQMLFCLEIKIVKSYSAMDLHYKNIQSMSLYDDTMQHFVEIPELALILEVVEWSHLVKLA